MGNAQSNPQLANLLSKVKPPAAAAPDPRAEIERKRIELTMAKKDLKNKQDAFDKLVPDEVTQKKTAEANVELALYKDTKVHQYNVELKLFDNALDQLKTAAANPAQEIAERYKAALQKKGKQVSEKFHENREQAYADRRRFLDADPQEGVSGIGWYSSADEQIMLIFWFSYILFLSTGIGLYATTYGSAQLGSTKNIAIIMSIVFVGAILLAHTLIKTLALN